MVTVPVSLNLPSDAWTVRVNSRMVSKSSFEASATVIAPLAASMAKAPLSFPAIMV
nr:hypothetical protein [Geotalea toluenoxydans]